MANKPEGVQQRSNPQPYGFIHESAVGVCFRIYLSRSRRGSGFPLLAWFGERRTSSARYMGDGLVVWIAALVEEAELNPVPPGVYKYSAF